jgi:hypothetical protein
MWNRELEKELEYLREDVTELKRKIYNLEIEIGFYISTGRHSEKININTVIHKILHEMNMELEWNPENIKLKKRKK